MSALYLHVPFCRRKCPYCDFFSQEPTEAQLAEYPSLLIRHLRLAARQAWVPGPLATVFFGGGTPSLLPPAAIGAILAAADAGFGLAADVEITLEANPGTLTAESLRGYRAAGINRLSLGVQSLDARHLQSLGRLHGPGEARRAVDWARRAGFAALSLDLIFALPEQSLDQLAEEIAAYLALSPEHLSCYGLSIEDDTPFAQRHRQGLLRLPDEDLYAAAFLLLHERLEAAGYRHYEISNYARPGHESRHNQVYWRRGAYLGLGAGAHSFRDRGWGERWAVPADLAAYRLDLQAGRDPARLLETFDAHGALVETLYLGLRTRSGVAEADLRARFGRGLREAFPAAPRRCAPHLEFSQGRWRFTPRGWLLYDHLISAFL
ncbi:radical SAM family heme chaperone HemW [Geoalkalibacter sp.]|uniref:radical SAM family heme chaperone HemW n=1 Tax=Geoalkalibacter sp. TaxID=3041440 RepID=UPI00272E42F3|nr:radical SAM family heme chaperone HemW [Geoalkalibacter sp.]